MAISFVGSAFNSAAGGADVTLTLPAMNQDDLVLVAYAIGDNDSITLNQQMLTIGYTEIADIEILTDGEDCYLGVYGKFMGATPDTTAQVDGLGGADASVAAVCMVFRGCDTTSLATMDANNTTATGIDGAHPDPPSISGLGATNWSVICGASAHLINTEQTYTFPTGYTTNAVDDSQTATETTYCTVGMGYKTNPADPEDPAVMTHSSSAATNSWCATTVPLYEAPAITATGTGWWGDRNQW